MNPSRENAARNQRVPSGERAWKVLLAIDGSGGARRAVEATACVPWPRGTEIKVVSVIDTRGDALLTGLYDTGEELETTGVRRRAAESALESARVPLARAGYTLSSATLHGSPAAAIIDEARAWHATVIVVGARGLGKVRGLVLGSVSAGVVRAADCSVLVVKKELKPLRVLVAVDASPHGPDAARKLSELRADGAPATILRVIEPPSIRSLRLLPSSASARLRSEIDAATRDLEQRARAQVTELAADFTRSGWKVQTSVVPGVPATEIKAMFTKTRATLACVGARGATGLERLLLGSVSEALLGTPGMSLFIGR
jgi:nucleotide-binding universal stress UspA family protein